MTDVTAGLVTFDCYGTLIDWRSGIAAAFDEAVPGAEKIERNRLLDAYASAEAEVESGPYIPYRDVQAAAAARAARLLDLSVPSSRRHFLAESLPSWRPFADTNPALVRLASAGLRLGILSNVDDDLLARTLEQLDVRFEALITAARVRSYKPAPGHFVAALEQVGRHPDKLLHVAESYYHDIQTAESLGIRTVWVNRTGQDRSSDPHPSAEVSDLTEAADWICRR